MSSGRSCPQSEAHQGGCVMTTFEYTLTIGIFGIADGAYAVAWTLLNDSDVEQAYG